MAKSDDEMMHAHRDDFDLIATPDMEPEPARALEQTGPEKQPEPEKARANAEAVEQVVKTGQLDAEVKPPPPPTDATAGDGLMAPTDLGEKEEPAPEGERLPTQDAVVAAPPTGKHDGPDPAAEKVDPGSALRAGDAVQTMITAADKAAGKGDGASATAPKAKSAPLPATPTDTSSGGDLIAPNEVEALGAETEKKGPDKAPDKGHDKEQAAPDKAGPRPAGTEDQYIGSAKGRDKDKYTYYDDPKRGRTYGWDVGGAQKVKHSGGQLSAAVYAVSNVEGTYDNVQTYDSAVLTFGIMQWTVHAGSLQKFLGFLKDGAGPDGKAAFDEHFLAHGIDVKGTKGQYELYYQGQLHKGPEDFDRLIRSSKETARQWVDWFHAAGVDPRVQKAQFDHAKRQFQEVQGTNLERQVAQALKRCPKTFFAKNQGNYGAASNWTGQSPKAAVIYFSICDNNPAYGNAALLKAVDAFYASHGTDRTKWPKEWPAQFASIFEGTAKDTLKSWGDTKNKKGEQVEGRVTKTLRFWDQANAMGAQKAGQDAVTTAAPRTAGPKKSAPAPHHDTPAAQKDAAPAHAAPVATASASAKKPDPGVAEKVQGYADALERKVKQGLLDAKDAASRFLSWASPFSTRLPENHIQATTKRLAEVKPGTEAKKPDATPQQPAIPVKPGAALLPTAGAAFHDGGGGKVLGAGDEVLRHQDTKDRSKQNVVIQAFQASPEGLVEAALYELHRGDKRSMAEVMADHSSARWDRGADAAVEQTTKGDWAHGRGLNDDGKTSEDGSTGKRSIGHVTMTNKKGEVTTMNAPTGPIQVYKTAAGMGTFEQGDAPMWCGAFVTYCLARCGVDVGSLAYAPTVGSKIAKAGGQQFHFDTTVEKSGDGSDRHKNKYSYGGDYHVGKAGDAKASDAETKAIHSGKEIDIRPGDVFYSESHTGLIVGVNKQADQIILRTVEGNSNDQVRSLVRVIKIDKAGKVVGANFEGWGRPAQFGKFEAPANEDWITAGAGGKSKGHVEGKTT